MVVILQVTEPQESKLKTSSLPGLPLRLSDLQNEVKSTDIFGTEQRLLATRSLHLHLLLGTTPQVVMVLKSVFTATIKKGHFPHMS